MKTTFSRTLMTFAVIMLATLLLLGFSLQLLVRNYLQNQAMEGLRSDSAIIADVAAAIYAETSLTDEDFLINLSIVANVSAMKTAFWCCVPMPPWAVSTRGCRWMPTISSRFMLRTIFPAQA